MNLQVLNEKILSLFTRVKQQNNCRVMNCSLLSNTFIGTNRKTSGIKAVIYNYNLCACTMCNKKPVEEV